MSMLSVLKATIFTSEPIIITCGADWARVPVGFFRLTKAGSESEILGHHDAAFGIRHPVPEEFTEGSRHFRLEVDRRELPLVQMNVRQLGQYGIMRGSFGTIIDTDYLEEQP